MGTSGGGARRIVLGWMLLVGATPARADDAHAHQLFTDGEAAYSAGRYEAAAAAFEQAFAETHKAALLWNIAQSYRHQYEIDQDVRTLRRARMVFANYATMMPDARTEAEAAIHEIDQRLLDAPPDPSIAKATHPEPEAGGPGTRLSLTPVRSPAVAPSPSSILAPPSVAAAPPARRPWLWLAVGGGAALLVAALTVGLVVGLTHDPAPTLGTVVGN